MKRLDDAFSKGSAMAARVGESGDFELAGLLEQGPASMIALRDVAAGVAGVKSCETADLIGEIVLLGYGALGGVTRLHEPVSGTELDSALKPYRKLAEQLSGMVVAVTSALENGLALRGEVLKRRFKVRWGHGRPRARSEVRIPEDLPKEWERHIREMQTIDSAAGEAVEDMAESYDAFTDAALELSKMQLDTLRSVLVRDLERVSAWDLEDLDRSFRIYRTLLVTMPTVAGLAADTLLVPAMLPPVGTPLGILWSTVDTLFFEKKLESEFASQRHEQRLRVALLSSYVLFPGAACQVGRFALAVEALDREDWSDVIPPVR